MKKTQEYSIGLDIGTNSVGWVVTNPQNKVLKFKNQNMMGVRKFDEGKSAAARRISRTTRRRFNKRRERLKLLDQFFYETIEGFDNEFMNRIKNYSFLTFEDKIKKGSKSKYNLFVDKLFTDKEYYKKYPTIYHLRKELVNSKDKVDIRLIYLAMHHIIKYRGNFLYEHQSFTVEAGSIETDIRETIDSYFKMIGKDDYCSSYTVGSIISLLKKDVSKSVKISNIKTSDIFSNDAFKSIELLLKGVVGLKCDLSKLFGEEITIDDKSAVIEFAKVPFEEVVDTLSATLGDKFEIIQSMHKIYSWIVLQEILQDSTQISDAMCKKYDLHKLDLQNLKGLLREYDIDSYRKLFKKSKDKKAKNYHNYINNSKYVKQEDLCKSIIKIIDKCDDKIKSDERYINIANRLVLNQLFPKPRNNENGAIPYQLHLKELESIIENQAKYYPFLSDNKRNICLLLEFRVPYYVGPLINKISDSKEMDNPFAWLIKKPGMEDVRILPWNLDDVVDIDATAMKFITRMTNKCTYFTSEDVLPKKSLLVSKYEVLNELNKIRVNDQFIEGFDKDKCINNVFLKYKKVTDKTLRKWLESTKRYTAIHEIVGYQKENEFSTSLDSWIDMTNIFGEVNDNNFEMIENIILWITVFEDKKILERKIRTEYGEILTQEQINKLMNLKYTGWSRLSKKLISGIRSNDGKTILEVLDDTNLNLMQIINDKKLGFKEIIEKSVTSNTVTKWDYKYVEELQGSPAIKKAIWQSIRIVDEITKIMKCAPSNIFVEMAREEGVKRRSTPRYKAIKDIYDALKKEKKIDMEIYNKLSESCNFNDDRIYLYFTQFGKSMYSGKPLDLSTLSQTTQIDHILPQSIIKDDSIENRVLVLSGENQDKLNSLTLAEDIISNQSGFWRMLHKNKLIGSKKLYNLTRKSYSEQDIEGFVNRQLVETRQITKHLVNLFKSAYDKTNVIAIKANLTNDFRKKYNVIKLRNLNDYHHAHDAYIISVIGNYISLRYPKLQDEFTYGKHLFRNLKNDSRNKHGFIIGGMDSEYIDSETGEVLWNPEKQITYIKKVFTFKQCFITHKLEKGDEQLFNLTVLPGDKNSEKGKTEARIPVNKNRENVAVYGGFSDIKYAFSVGVAYIKNNKNIDEIINIPSYVKESEVLKYVIEITNDCNAKIITPKIYKNQLVRINGGYFRMSSAKELVNAKQLILDLYEQKLLQDINISKITNDYSNVNEDTTLRIYNAIIEKLDLYYPRFGRIKENLITERKVFESLDIEGRVFILLELLNVTSCKPVYGSLVNGAFNLKKSQGRVTNFTMKINETTFINESITGLYSKEVSYGLKNSNDNKSL